MVAPEPIWDLRSLVCYRQQWVAQRLADKVIRTTPLKYKRDMREMPRLICDEELSRPSRSRLLYGALDWEEFVPARLIDVLTTVALIGKMVASF